MQASNEGLSILYFSMPLFRGVAEAVLHCAHRPTVIHLYAPSKLARFSLGNGTRAGPTAAVERAHSDRARSGSKGSARVSFHSFHRGGSASKKGTWPLPSILLRPRVASLRVPIAPYLSGRGRGMSRIARVQRGLSEAARCASTRDTRALCPATSIRLESECRWHSPAD